MAQPQQAMRGAAVPEQPVMAAGPQPSYGAAEPRPLIGQPVLVAAGGAPRPPAPQNENPSAQKFYGQWSSDTFDCCSNLEICCLTSCCWPLYSVYQEAALFPERLGSLELPGLGTVSGDQLPKYAIAVFIVVLLCGLIGQMSGGIVPVRDQGHVNHHEMVYSPVGSFFMSVAGLVEFVWLFMVYKGVMSRFNIKEDDCTACLCVFCCNCCTMTKVYRHVQDYDLASRGMLIA